MIARGHLCSCAIGLMMLCGCASNVDVPPERGISQDISGTRQIGPTSLRPGQSQLNRPSAASPGRLEDLGPAQ